MTSYVRHSKDKGGTPTNHFKKVYTLNLSRAKLNKKTDKNCKLSLIGLFCGCFSATVRTRTS